MLRPEREAHYAPFLRDYTAIRHQEQRGSSDPEFFRALPDCPADHPLAWQWEFHGRTYAALVNEVLPRLSSAPGAALAILDLGAGLGWLSHRLATLGHRPCAVDITVDDLDGLGATRHYPERWPVIQAEFDALPLADAQADVVLFNASLHYSTDYLQTLREALRVLRPGGHLLVLESPVYRHAESGRLMVEQRHAEFEDRFGTRSDSIPSLEFLTWDGIAHLGAKLELRFRAHRVHYGWYATKRRWKARLLRQREKASFPLLIARKPGG